jgi:hypothetical protein
LPLLPGPAHGGPELAAVLGHERPRVPVHDVDISDAAGILAEEAQRREDKFSDSWAAEHNNEDVLARKFEEAPARAIAHFLVSNPGRSRWPELGLGLPADHCSVACAPAGQQEG